MNRNEVGKLQAGMKVMVGGQIGVVAEVHEPEWIDNKTNDFIKELQGAYIRFSGDRGRYIYINAGEITMLPNTVDMRSTTTK